MRDENMKKSKLSWPKTLVKKWLNNKSNSEEFYADYMAYGGCDEEWKSSYSESIKKSKIERSNGRTSEGIQRGRIVPDTHMTDVDNYRIFVATWNVAGKSPPSNLSLEDWLHTSPPADIYVLGFQEIVPLNAGNVFGSEDNSPAKKWLALLRKTLNSLPGTSGCGGFQTPSPIPNPLIELDADFEKSSSIQKASSIFHRRYFQSLSRSMRIDNDTMHMMVPQSQLDRRFSVCDRIMFRHRESDYDPNSRWGSSDDENGIGDSSPVGAQGSPVSYCGSGERGKHQSENLRYCLVASKQMVGIFLTVWVKSNLSDDVRNMKVSCVGRGLMGYLGNKGSISISMSVHETSFCFICSHLTSGQKEGDELRRNSDVLEILRKTRFPRVHAMGNEKSPETILEHDRIIWLGDLNYRIALSYRSVKALVEMRNWRALFENDQLWMEQHKGRVFKGWNEGSIYFPPTYKYSNNSDRYAGDTTKEKRRTPAWCDRILWYGKGFHQLLYVRGESRFSDHRPVYSIFLAEVESIMNVTTQTNKISMNGFSSRIEIEELLPGLYGYNNPIYF